MQEKGSRQWVFTYNNPPDEWDPSSFGLTIQFCCYNMEIAPVTGTPHFQGYVVFTSYITVARARSWVSGLHIEQKSPKSTEHQCVAYCCKDFISNYSKVKLGLPTESTYEDWMIQDMTTLGFHVIDNRVDSTLNIPFATWVDSFISITAKKTNKRKADWAAIKVLMDDGAPLEEIQDTYWDTWASYYRQIDVYRAAKSKKRDPNTPVEVHVICGPTGTGKTRYVSDNYSELYYKPKDKGSTSWWNGYDGQDVVILDEFYGWLSYDDLLRLCDRYPLTVETKGSSVQMTATKIFITSNTNPEDWYKRSTIPQQRWDAFIRRVTSWETMNKLGEHNKFEQGEAGYKLFQKDLNLFPNEQRPGMAPDFWLPALPALDI